MKFEGKVCKGSRTQRQVDHMCDVVCIRKPDKSELEELGSPCPYCDSMLSEMELACYGCKNNVPFCIATVTS